MSEYVLQVTPAQAIILRDMVMHHLPETLNWMPPVDNPDPQWTNLEPSYFKFAHSTLDFKLRQQIKAWFGEQVAEACYQAGMVTLKVVEPLFSRRIKWWAKLAFPQINTQTTAFKLYDQMEFVYHYQPKLMEVSRMPGGGYEPSIRYSTERVSLKVFKGVGNLTRCDCFLVAGYCQHIDTCLIYNSDPRLIQRLKRMYPMDWRLYYASEFSR